MPIRSVRERRVSSPFLLAVVAAFLLFAPGLVGASGPDAHIRGYVTDAGSSAGIAGAAVRIEATDLPWVFDATTDGAGYFDVVLPPHRYSLTVTAAAYNRATTTAAPGSGQVVWANVTLTPAASRSARLQGHVTDSVSSAPVTVGRVLAGPPWWGGGAYANASALDPSGYYAMALVPGSYQIDTEGTFGYAAYSDYPVSVISGQTLWYNFSLAPNPVDAWLNGTVRDAATSAPIPGAQVTARVDGLQFPFVVSNGSGVYSMQVSSGSVELAGDAPGYAPTWTTTYLSGGGQYLVDVALVPLSSAVRGYVRDGLTGLGIPGANVTIDPLFSNGYYDRATTNMSGYYDVPLPDDVFIVRASAPGYTTFTTFLFFFSGPTVWSNITLWPIISTVSGYVVDALNGSRIAGLTVIAIDTRSGYYVTVVTDAAGFYSIALPPSPAITVAVYGRPPYSGEIVYTATRPYATTWVNVSLDRLAAQFLVNVTDALTGSPISGAIVSVSWYYGSSSAFTNATGQAVVDTETGFDVFLSVYATGYLFWYDIESSGPGSNPLSIALYPDVPQSVRVRGYVRDANTSSGLWPATVTATGYDGETYVAYADGTGYYDLSIVPGPQTVRATADGYAAAEAPVNGSSGAVLWINFTLATRPGPPAIANFTATPSVGVTETNPTTLRADVNASSIELTALSILMLQSSSGNVGTFLNLGRVDPADVRLTGPGPAAYEVSASWDTRTPVARLSDGLSVAWWPTLLGLSPYLAVVYGYWDNATLTNPVSAAAVFDTRSGSLLYVVVSGAFFGPQDDPSATFSPYALGVRIELTSAAIVGYTLVTGPSFSVRSLRLDLSPTVPSGRYAALLEVWDGAGGYTSAATLLQTAPDTVPPVANAGADRAADEDTTVPFDASGSTDNVGIVNYTWAFTDGSPMILLGPRPSYVFATPGTYVVTLTVRDADGNVATDTVTITVRDVTAPAVSVTAPLEGAVLSGSVLVTVDAVDNVAVVRVELFLDGVSMGNDTTTPFGWVLGLASLESGNHTILSVAYDAAGNSASTTRHVTVVPASAGGLDAVLAGGLFLIVLVAAAIAVVFLLLRRRRPRRPYTAPPTSGPSIAPGVEEAPSPTAPEDLPDVEQL